MSITLPQHLAIIMDGNGRWAEKYHLPRIEGHRRGVEATERMVEACQKKGIPYLTLYAFSEENWNRPESEVVALMELLALYVKTKRQKMVANGIRFLTIGDIARLPKSVQMEIAATKLATAHGSHMTLIMALSYGARQELCRAVERLNAEGVKDITPDDISRALDTREIPDPDLLIRTSGEYRISNFLLWQLAYAELYFTETLWPDVDEAVLDEALMAFAKRERRFGLTSRQLKEQTA